MTSLFRGLCMKARFLLQNTAGKAPEKNTTPEQEAQTGGKKKGKNKKSNKQKSVSIDEFQHGTAPSEPKGNQIRNAFVSNITGH